MKINPEHYYVLFSSCIDIWELDLDGLTWEKKDVPGTKPLPRYGHSQIVIDDQHILVVGGCGGPNMVMILPLEVP